MTKANQAGQKAANTTKATHGDAGDKGGLRGGKANGYVIAEGQAFHGRNGRLEAGTAITAKDLATAKDPTGETEFARQIANGTLVPGSGKAATDDRAGGGTIDDGGATGAAPSAAQITAAQTGDDPEAAKVVDAAMTGSEADLAKANGVEGDGKGEGA